MMLEHLFDQLSQLVARSSTRRSAFATLLGVVPLGIASNSAAVKGPSDGKRIRQRKKSRKGQHRAHAQAKAKPGNHCQTPFGLDLNALYGVSAQIVNGFCPTVGSGEKWIAAGAPWFVNNTFEAEPADFVRAGDTPLADFQAKFTALKLVIDRDTQQARTVVFPNSSQLFIGPGDAFPLIPSDWVLISPITLGTVQPLSVGDHVVEVYWVFSATHCDGVGDSIVDNCLPAGDVLYVTVEFAVTPGHN